MGPMADPENSHPAGRPTESGSDAGPGAHSASEVWIRRIVVALVLLVVAFIVYRMAAAAVPRWWAQRIAGQVDNRMSVGVFWGLFYGSVFTFVPILLIWQVRRPFLTWPWKVAVAVVALAFALPNLLTLGISLGNNSASDAAWITLVSQAPGFQWATLFGAIGGALLALLLIVTLASSRRRKSQVGELKGQLAERDAPTDDREEPHA